MSDKLEPQPVNWAPPKEAEKGEGPPPVTPPTIDVGDVVIEDAGPQVEKLVEAPVEKVESPPEEKVEFKGLLVRTGGDNIFLLKEGQRRWVTSPEVLTKLGFKFGDEVEIDRLTLNVIPEGEPLR